jgi:hypothetical protein
MSCFMEIRAVTVLRRDIDAEKLADFPALGWKCVSITESRFGSQKRPHLRMDREIRRMLVRRSDAAY